MSILLTGAGHLGDIPVGATFGFKFNTHKADGTPIVLDGTPVAKVYKRGSTTEDDSGITLTADYDSVVGLNDVVIDLSSDGTFYATGFDYQVVLTAGTVDTISVVGSVIATFSIGKGVDVTRWHSESIPATAQTGVPKVDSQFWKGEAIPATADTGVPKVNLVAIEGDETSADDFKDFVDSGYDPSTNKVQGVVAVDSTEAIGTAAETSVRDQVQDYFENETYSEMGQQALTYPLSLISMIKYLFKKSRNKTVHNRSTGYLELYNDDASTVGQKQLVSDTGGATGSATIGEVATGP